MKRIALATSMSLMVRISVDWRVTMCVGSMCMVLFFGFLPEMSLSRVFAASKPPLWKFTEILERFGELRLHTNSSLSTPMTAICSGIFSSATLQASMICSARSSLQAMIPTGLGSDINHSTRSGFCFFHD